jgi:glycosyltransferase involved in cell wall biosynthesis
VHPLIVTPAYPPATGGAATYFGAAVAGLLARPEIHELTVLTEQLPGYAADFVEGKLRVLRQLPTRVAVARRNRVADTVGYLQTQLWFEARLPRLVRRLGVDLIDFHTRYRGWMFHDALRRSRVPLIASVHDQLAKPRTLASFVRRLVCPAQSVRRFVAKGGFPVDRTVLIPLPFTVPRVPSAEQVADARHRYALGPAPYVLFIGDITARKGVYELLDGYRGWRSSPPQAQLVLAGTNRGGGRFVRRVQRTAGALYVGEVPHTDALALIRGAGIVALPSRSEGLPYVILEAVALGTKVICPPGIPEFDAVLPDWVLPDVSAEAITATLRAVWARRDAPSYPLSEHRLVRAIDELVDLYASVVDEAASATPP